MFWHIDVRSDGLSRKAFFIAWCSWFAADGITSSLVGEGVSWSARKLPDVKEVNWKDDRIVTPTRDQKSCQCCWAIVAADVITSHWKKYKDSNISYSPQYLLDFYDLDRRGDEFTNCFTLSINKAFDWIVENGISQEDDYPFLAMRQKPPPILKPPKYQPIESFKVIPDSDNSRRELLMAVKEHLVAAAMLVDLEFRYWTGWEIYSGPTKFPAEIGGAHAVQVIGFGRDESQQKDFWYILSSWGSDWGVGGIARVDRSILTVSTYRNEPTPLVYRASYPLLVDDE
ncbi:hypothetical protein V6N12_066491 [Hibiscus sabdariffa]|uniref:Peptidase C1A papain C-terminal domain-containing protein n=1 Tax=Hibiscus sabdariffa TaxID=183260 RepID=A0ABR2CQA4_9ROSI